MSQSPSSVVQFLGAAFLVQALGACAPEPTAPEPEPAQLEVPLAAGYYHTCALSGSRAAYCWGWNIDGALGIGSTTPDFFRIPVAVSGGLSFTTLTASESHNCALTSSGAAYCWGSAWLGDGSTGSSIPVAVSGGLRFTTIAASSGHTCALNGSGAAYCWGWNLEGQLGIGSTTNHQPTPVAVSGGLTFSALAVGDYHTCALTTSGAAYCWGANFRGQLGDGSTTNRSAPVAVSGGLSFSSLAAGEFHTCALTSSGSAYCWGENAVGQLGDSSTTRRSSPVAVAGGLSFRALAAGSGLESRAHTCALTSSGAAYCWGGNDAGELGDGVTKSEICERNSDSFRCSRTPVAVAGGLTFSALTVGGFHTCGLTTAGAAYCWGANGWGQLGTDSTTGSSIPVAVSGGLIFGASAPDLKSAGSGGTAIRP